MKILLPGLAVIAFAGCSGQSFTIPAYSVSIPATKNTPPITISIPAQVINPGPSPTVAIVNQSIPGSMATLSATPVIVK